MAGVSDTYERIDALISQAEPRLARVFYSAIQSLRDGLDLNLVAAMLEQGRYEELLAMLQNVAEKVAAHAGTVFVAAGQSTAEFLQSADVAHIVFDAVNWRAVEQMRAARLDLIREFADSQRAVLRSVMSQGITEGIGPVDQARRFRSVVGLTEYQNSLVDSYRASLNRVGQPGATETQQRATLSRALRDGRSDRVVEAAIRQGRTLDQATIDKWVARYAERSVKQRAINIARTEALRAVHMGAEQAFAQAIAEGKIDPRAIEETWNSARDRRVRESHVLLNGQTKGWGGVWQGLYGVLRFPCDPDAPARETVNCRCIVTRTIRRINSY